MIRELHNTSHVDPWVNWGPSKFYLLKDFANIPLSITLEYQVDTNMYCAKHDQQSSNCLHSLVFTLIKIFPDEIFFMPCSVVNALKNFLKIQGKNFSVITKQLHSILVIVGKMT